MALKNDLSSPSPASTGKEEEDGGMGESCRLQAKPSTEGGPLGQLTNRFIYLISHLIYVVFRFAARAITIASSRPKVDEPRCLRSSKFPINQIGIACVSGSGGERRAFLFSLLSSPSFESCSMSVCSSLCASEFPSYMTDFVFS